MLNIQKYESKLSKQEYDLYKILNEQCEIALNQRRGNYKVIGIVNAGNKWGEKRVFGYLEKEIGKEKGILFTEGIEGKRDADTLKRKVFFMAPLISLHPSPTREMIINSIQDIEEEGKDVTFGINEAILPKGLSAFEAFPIHNRNVNLFGIENIELFKVQYELAKAKRVDDYYFEVAKLRSEVMVNKMIDYMDSEGFEKGYVSITGFHDKTFIKNTSLRGINYKSIYVHKMDKWE